MNLIMVRSKAKAPARDPKPQRRVGPGTWRSGHSRATLNLRAQPAPRRGGRRPGASPGIWRGVGVQNGCASFLPPGAPRAGCVAP